MPGPRRSLQLKGRGYDNVLADKGYRTLEGSVVNEYEAMME
jgi:hypothetical protein